MKHNHTHSLSAPMAASFVFLAAAAAFVGAIGWALHSLEVSQTVVFGSMAAAAVVAIMALPPLVNKPRSRNGQAKPDSRTTHGAFATPLSPVAAPLSASVRRVESRRSTAAIFTVLMSTAAALIIGVAIGYNWRKQEMVGKSPIVVESSPLRPPQDVANLQSLRGPNQSHRVEMEPCDLARLRLILEQLTDQREQAEHRGNVDILAVARENEDYFKMLVAKADELEPLMKAGYEKLATQRPTSHSPKPAVK